MLTGGDWNETIWLQHVDQLKFCGKVKFDNCPMPFDRVENKMVSIYIGNERIVLTEPACPTTLIKTRSTVGITVFIFHACHVKQKLNMINHRIVVKKAVQTVFLSAKRQETYWIEGFRNREESTWQGVRDKLLSNWNMVRPKIVRGLHFWFFFSSKTTHFTAAIPIFCWSVRV